MEDKARYQAEKDMFKGSWKVKRRKDPNAPKRPMSAYLAFSNSRRAIATKENPVATNSEISKILSKMWKEAPQEVKQKYIDEEAELREEYKVAMTKWKKEAKERKRTTRKAVAAEAKKTKDSDDEITIKNSTYHEEATPMSHAAHLPLPGTVGDNASSSYSRLLAAAGLDVGSNRMRERELAYHLRAKFSENNRGGLGGSSSISPLPGLASAYRSPLTALLGGSGRATSGSQAQQLLSRLSAGTNTSISNGGNIDERLYGNLGNGLLTNNYQRVGELDIMSLLGLSNSSAQANNYNLPGFL